MIKVGCSDQGWLFAKSGTLNDNFLCRKVTLLTTMTVEQHDRDQAIASLSATKVDDLLIQCHCLLKELELFQEFLVERKREHTVELRQFHSSIVSELKSLQRVRRPATARMTRRTMLTS